MKHILILLLILIFSDTGSQNIDEDELLDKIERIERNISDLQKGDFSKSNNLSGGYISRNEERQNQLESLSQNNFGKIEELENKIEKLEGKLDKLNQEIDFRLKEISDKLSGASVNTNINISDSTGDQKQSSEIEKKQDNENLKSNLQNNIDIKEKYENAIRLLWSNELDSALEELKALKQIKPENLMPNIQYWLGEVYYAKKDFNQAIIEFGEGLKNYPESIKGPDNMLKLGLSFSNIQRKAEACSVLIELQVKYSDAAKNVLQRAEKEKKKLSCPSE